MDPFSQELLLREAGVQRDNVYRDIGVSGATGTDQRQGWHRLMGVSPEAILWLWSASTGSAGGGWTPSSASSPCGPGE